MNNKWSEKVMARISSVHDLPAADAMYHQICSSNFRTGKSIPLVFMSDADEQPASKRGRFKDSFQEEAFLQVMADLQQHDEEQTTINDLIDNMKTYLGDRDSLPYGFTYMKKKIKDHYGDDIIIAGNLMWLPSLLLHLKFSMTFISNLRGMIAQEKG